MPRIIFVPGKNPKPPPAEHRAWLLRCMLEGVRRVDPATAGRIAADERQFQLASWSHDFYKQHRDISQDIPGIEALLKCPGETAADRKTARNWRVLRTRLLYNAADVFPPLIRQIRNPTTRTTLEETRRYFENHGGIAEHIRELLKKELRAGGADDRVLLIGHSLGSVIAYDTLWSMTHEDKLPASVDLYLTMGSPLGMRFVQSRLRGHNQSGEARYPHGIRCWFNVAAVGDLTALDAKLANDFREMPKLGLVDEIRDLDRRFYNFYHDAAGLNVHRAYGYLVNPAVGRIIAEWWNRGR